MSISGIIFIVTFVALMIIPFIFMFTKANYHFEYLKKLYPEKFNRYNNYLDTSKNLFFNKYVGLIFPLFKRRKTQETTEELSKLGNRIKLFCKLTYYSLIVLALYVTILIVFFGDFS